MKILVTGATGFIGRILVERLLEEGNEVIALVRASNHHLPEKVQIVYGNILDPNSLTDLGKGCCRLYHLAAMVDFNPRKRTELLSVNGEGTFNILSMAYRLNIETTVVVSSACTMGLSFNKEQLLDEESHPNQKMIDDNPYLESKLACEKTALTFSRKMKVVIVNPTTVYGPGDFTLNSGTLVKKVAKSYILPIPAGGSNVIDVDDVVSGIILAAQHGTSGSRYILGAQNLLFQEIITSISDAVGRKPIFLPLSSKFRIPLSSVVGLIGKLQGNRFLTSQIINDMFLFKYYSIKKAISELGFEARYNFNETAKRAWLFYQKNGLIN